MQHELFHAVQGLATRSKNLTTNATTCIAQKPGGEEIGNLFDSLEMEGTASEVGDELMLPVQGADTVTTKERAEFARNVDLVRAHVTQMELSVHGLATGVALTYEDVYAADFYGNQDLYGLGYVMARAIAREEGAAAIGTLIAEPGFAFVVRYMHLKDYGRKEGLPKLGKATEEWALQMAACSARRA